MFNALSAGNVRRSVARLIVSRSVASVHSPKAPLDLDPSYRALLDDINMAVSRNKSRLTDPGRAAPPRELEVFPNDPTISQDRLSSEELDAQEDDLDRKEHRKSPAALFGSQRIGAVTLPLELQNSISRLISEADRPLLHNDAKRLFLDDTGDKPQWDTAYDAKYKNKKQAFQHAERDGTAFVSVALPAHFAAISSVLDHIKQRLGPDWNVGRVIDWGSGTGSGLWASLYSFQRSLSGPDNLEQDPRISNTTVLSYLGIDKRDGLVKIAKRLLEGTEVGTSEISWRRSLPAKELDIAPRSRDILALSAFTLSSLPTPLARKAVVQEMWESDADVMILIDHNTRSGFECIAEAREFLLRQGRKASEPVDSVAARLDECHVVAPCPHDGACPLYNPGSSKLLCNFSQRLQRPDFVRKTKHSGVGHEDIGYSYVVIRRGERPPRTITQEGRVGDVGRRELAKTSQETPIAELLIHEDQHDTASSTIPSISTSDEILDTHPNMPPALSGDELTAALRHEAYNWPRLVFPPLKRSGHIIIDGCTQEGKIMRITIPKSQGKQPFYDARKSTWGDIFPHNPKNRPQERFFPPRVTRSSGTDPIRGADIGKRGSQPPRAPEGAYKSSKKSDTRKLRRDGARAKLQAEEN